MVWQQWVLLIWYLIRVLFIINAEVKKDRSNKPRETWNQSIVIGICVWLGLAAILIALVVTI